MPNWPHRLHGIAFECRRIWRQGLSKLLLKLVVRIASVMLWFVLLPATIAMHLAGFRRVTVFTDRIGHLALEPDCLLKEQALGLIPKRKWFILAPPGRVANEHLLKYWEPFFRIYRGRFICFVLASMSSWGLMRHDITHYIGAIGKAQAAYRIYAKWGNRPPFLSLLPEDEAWGRQAVRQLGVPEGAWFVCIHAREGGFSPVDEEIHAHRNGNIEALMPAALEITRRGGWVIRIGDSSMKPMPPIPNLIDYAHHPMKSERLDVILCARAKFLLGNTSGIALVATVFGVPCALANMVPMAAMGIGARDISIPKMYWLIPEKRYLRFAEVFSSSLSRAQHSAVFAEAKIRIDENKPEDIRELVVEMLDRLEGNSVHDPEGKTLQEKFRGFLTDSHYAFGTPSNISTLFLGRWKQLLD